MTAMEGQLTNCLKKFRKAAGMTQEELADRVGVTRQTIIAIEKGNYTPSVMLALKLGHVLDKKVETIFRCID
jgi:putative transcriptional regulator